MERLEQSVSFGMLRQANQGLREFLTRNAEAVEGSDDDVRAMLEVERIVRSVGPELDRLQRSDSAEIRLELELYRDNLLRLRQKLGAMQNSTTQCQARLFVREKHLRAAQAWCEASRSSGEIG